MFVSDSGIVLIYMVSHHKRGEPASQCSMALETYNIRNVERFSIVWQSWGNQASVVALLWQQEAVSTRFRSISLDKPKILASDISGEMVMLGGALKATSREQLATVYFISLLRQHPFISR